MQLVLDFVEGKVDCETFKKAWYADPSIGHWLDQLVDLKSPLPPEWDNLPYSPYRKAIHNHYDGSALAFIQASDNDPNKDKYAKWVHIGWRFHVIAAVVVVAYPHIVPTSFYDDEQNFYMNAVGDYIGGVEVEGIIGETIAKFPASLGKTKRKKEAKAAIRALFHVEGCKYPRWVQEPEWPMGKLTPMAYVSQKRSGELVRFMFRDVDTEEIRIVEQLY